MGKRIYLDTNIYLDYLLERKNKQGDDLESKAFRIFERTVSCEFEIILSSWTLEELDKYVPYDKIKFLLASIKKKTILVKHTPENITYAKTISPHFQDIVHGLLAIQEKADVIVTRDIKGFKKLDHLLQAVLPEDI